MRTGEILGYAARLGVESTVGPSARRSSPARPRARPPDGPAHRVRPTLPATRSTTHLDPRSPLVLDTRELGRRPGSMRRVQRTAPAPEGWGLELVRVPAGSPMELDLRLESVVDGVLVTGVLHADVEAECGRCLEPVHDTVDVDIQELFAYAPDGEDELPVLEGDFLDLEPLARDALLLALPLNPVCAEECSGLCAGCGEPLRDLAPDHSHDQIDPRWAALHAIADTSADPASPEIGS